MRATRIVSLARGTTRNRGCLTVFYDSIFVKIIIVFKSLFDLLDKDLFGGIELISFAKINFK